jgi:hypothetical protein
MAEVELRNVAGCAGLVTNSVHRVALQESAKPKFRPQIPHQPMSS